MKKIDIIPWNDNFLTGIKQIDSQHKKLVEIINTLATSFAYNSHELNIDIIFDELIDYTIYHFDSEEKIWKKYFKNSRSKKEHEEKHKNFVDELKKLIDLQKQKPIEEIAEKTLDFLVQWLVSHILESDRFMAYKVLAVDSGETLEDARKIANNKMNGQGKELTNLVMNMYKVLSRNTLNLMKETAKQENTKIKLLEEKLKYKKLMTLGSDMIFILDYEGNLLEYSSQVQKSLGYTTKEMKSLKIFDWNKIITKEQNDEILKLLSDEPLNINTTHTRKDGTKFNVEISAVKVKINDKNYVYASSKDLSERIKNEEIIKNQRDEFEAIFKYSKDGIAILDFESNFLNFNDTYLEMTGFTKEELLTKSCIGLTAPEDKNRFIKAMEKILKYGFVSNYEKRCMKKDGALIHVNMTGSLIPNKNRIIIITKDVSSIKIMEEQAKMASMGEMIGNIAHQWRQPLSVITTGITGIKLQNELNILSNDYLNNMCELINNNAQYLSKTIDDFRNYIRGERVLKEFNLEKNINSFLKLMEGTIKQNHILLNIDVDSNINIKGYPNELIQCFINIFNNSKDALKNIETKKLIFIEAKVNDNYAIISFKDNANGIPEKILPKIFEPYFTTKHKSKGTGLGLSMTYNLITNGMKGKVLASNIEYKYENDSYVGVEFIIKIPLK